MCCFVQTEVVTNGFTGSACLANCSLVHDLVGTHEQMPPLRTCRIPPLLWWSHRRGLPSVHKSRLRPNLPFRSLASTDVKISFADVLHTTGNLAVLVLQFLAVNASNLESDVLHCASLADPCEIVRVHIAHCCVSVGLLAVLRLRFTRDELDFGFPMLPWHSIISSAARSSDGLSDRCLRSLLSEESDSVAPMTFCTEHMLFFRPA